MATEIPVNGDKRAQAIATALDSVKLDSLGNINTKQLSPKVAIIADLLHAGAFLFVGRPKIGKSWLLLQLVLAVAEGGTFLGFDCGSGEREVLAIFAEDDDERIQRRMRALGVAKAPANVQVINREKLIELARQFRGLLTLEEFLDAWLEKRPRTRLVVLDTETACRAMWNGEQQQRDSRRITVIDYDQTRAFDQIAHRRNVAIPLVNHTGKKKGGREFVDPHEMVNRTNTALAGASGSIVLADLPNADPYDVDATRRTFSVRGRDLDKDVQLVIDRDPNIPMYVSKGAYHDVRQTEGEQEILECIEDDFGIGQFVTTVQLAQALGKNRNTVKTLVRRMLRGNRTVWKTYRIVAKRGPSGGIKLDPLVATGGPP